MACIVSIHFQFSRLVVSVSLWPHGKKHARPPCLITSSRSLLKPMLIESEMPSTHLILCCPLLLPPSSSPSIRIFSNESVLLNLLIYPIHWSLFLSTCWRFHMEWSFFCFSISFSASTQVTDDVRFCLKCVLFSLWKKHAFIPFWLRRSWFLHSGFLSFREQGCSSWGLRASDCSDLLRAWALGLRLQ